MIEIDVDVRQEVLELVQKAAKSESSDGALKFSQAACNIANARASMVATSEVIHRISVNQSR